EHDHEHGREDGAGIVACRRKPRPPSPPHIQDRRVRSAEEQGRKYPKRSGEDAWVVRPGCFAKSPTRRRSALSASTPAERASVTIEKRRSPSAISAVSRSCASRRP